MFIQQAPFQVGAREGEFARQHSVHPEVGSEVYPAAMEAVLDVAQPKADLDTLES